MKRSLFHWIIIFSPAGLLLLATMVVIITLRVSFSDSFGPNSYVQAPCLGVEIVNIQRNLEDSEAPILPPNGTNCLKYTLLKGWLGLELSATAEHIRVHEAGGSKPHIDSESRLRRLEDAIRRLDGE